MNLINNLKESLFNFLKQKFSLNKNTLEKIDITLNTDANKQQFGDFSTNAALILSKELKKNPREIASAIANNFCFNFIDKIEIAGPGFINIFLDINGLKELAKELYNKKEDFFKTLNFKPEKISIEFISANPTGLLYLSHGRGGIIGDVLGNILSFLGNKVTKEFYINDAGRQIKKLGESFKIRCLQELGQDVSIPEDGYKGEYLVILAKQCINQYGQELTNKPESFFENYAKDYLLKEIKDTLKFYGIEFDVWFSEMTLHESGAIEKVLDKLQNNGYLYTKDGALWFKSTEFGDDKDRVLKRNNGELTYIAADIAYLQNKIDRGFEKLIMTLGQDHHGYVARLKAALQALGYNPDILNIILYQLVTLKVNNQEVRMSKRAGLGVYLKDIIDTVGRDVTRFFYLNKNADTQLDFDLDLALKHTDENPVYYIQYAYVRTNSILEKANQIESLQNIDIQDIQYLTQAESLLLKKIGSLANLLKNISKNYQTHLLSYYTIELAQLFHSYYGSNKVIDIENINQSRSRLLITKLINQTLKTCFDLLGISAPEKM